MLAQDADVTLTWPAIAGGIASVTVILGAVVGVVAWSYRRLVARIRQDVGVPAREAAAQLATSNGRTVADYVEAAAADITSLKATAQRNQETALAALALGRQNSERLDWHIVAGHREETP